MEEFDDFGLGTNKMLKKVRLHGNAMTVRDMQEFYSEVVAEGVQVGNRHQLAKMDVHRANRELYKFLHKRLTVRLKAASVLTCMPGEGFELYRMLNKKLDPNNAISQHTLLADVRRLAFMKCKDLAETRTRIVQLIGLCSEYCDKTGKEIELTENTFAVCLFLDEESTLRADRKGMSEATDDFDKVCRFLEELSNEEGNKKAIADYAKQQAPVKMDLSSLNPKDPEQAAAAAAEAAEAETAQASLDALGNMECFKCGGIGHRQADCPSRPEVQLACNTCGGWGHYASECPSKGKGDAGKGKGNGGKGKGKGDWGKGKGDANKGGKGWSSKGWGKDKGKSGMIKGKGKGKGGGKGKGKLN